MENKKSRCEVCGKILNNRSYHCNNMIVCRKHYTQFIVHNKFLDNTQYYTCEICGRQLGSICYCNGKRVCSKHYSQYRTYGKFLDNNPRTQFDPNEIIIKKNKAIMNLYDASCNICGQTKINIEDIDIVSKYKWCMTNCNGKNYVISYKKNKLIYLHRYIMGVNKKSKVVDHINGDTLDNRKKNLRITTMNMNIKNTNASGVYYDNKNGVFYSQIMCNKIRYILGRYADVNEAIYVRWYAEKLLFGEFQHNKKEPTGISNSNKSKLQNHVNYIINKTNNRFNIN